ncbi:MAG: ribonuclease R [Bacteroidales bacterium]|jgi:ribonuclease R|nr:ribonuclease R [Bacteroidales bacterium]
MSKKQKSGAVSNISKEKLAAQIRAILSENPRQALNHKQISKKLNITDSFTKQLIPDVLNELTVNNLLQETAQGQFRIRQSHGHVTGIVDLTRMGAGFITGDDIEDDIFVSSKNLKTAINGDRVKVKLYAKRKGARPEGEVVEIIERAKSTFVGTIEEMPNFAFLIPDNKNMPFDMFVPSSKLNGAKQGMKAVAKVVDWSPKSRNPVAEIVEVLGYPGDNETEMHAILAEFELPHRFDPEVEAEAATISSTITEEDIQSRRDFRQVPTFTIDPDDANDFDDALSLRSLDSGLLEVGIHIADVTHYVRQGTAVDEEAKSRATSVYMVDRVVPMLPEKLSNNVCSLNPHEDKLTFSAVFEMNEKAEIVNEWFGRTIINSDRRFSYAEAQLVIDTGEGDMQNQLSKLHRIARILRKKRYDSGAFDFERSEIKFELDEKGKPIGIKLYEAGTSNQLIEEFMLLANRRVAEFVSQKLHAKPFIYRIHDRPSPDKIGSFNTFVSRFGYKLNNSDKNSLPKALNGLLRSAVGKKEQNIIENLALRAMAKAVYSTENIGHYGLAFKYYTHFTSPIRRYPDMIVHRLLAAYLAGVKPGSTEKYQKLCDHSSKMEKLAVDAERASIKYKQVEFLSDKTGQTFEGVISGVTEWGIYVEITENMCEGMIHIREMADDYYEYDEENYCISGRSSGKKYTLGDNINIIVVKADLQKKQLDFRLAE